MKYSLSFLLVLFVFPIVAQYNFDDYHTLQSEGDIPDDFLSQTYLKIDARIAEKNVDIKNDIEQRVFLTKTMYAVDELLHSGYVVYGDPLSQHVTKIASLLLKDRPDLISKLRFYTLKSDETNAFSTDEGIIFVTTGLISQLENDAQLAYVLAHEIIHFEKKHVLKLYTWSRQNTNGTDWVKNMSQYSKENELEADLLAVDLYKQAGFSLKGIENVFDILLYSYLPFEEEKITLDYFKSDSSFIPEKLFLLTDFPIKAEENVDDNEATHPNIAKRKSALLDKLSELTGDWGNNLYQVDQETFLNIRSLARFECLRYQVMNAHFSEALYSIFILEKSFPNSIYLKRLKAQSWLGIYQYFKVGNRSNLYPSKKKWEGEIAKVHQFLSHLDKKNCPSFSIRYIYDLHQANPDDKEIAAVFSQLCKELGADPSFDINVYFKKSFQAASLDTNSPLKDSLTDQDPTPNKYEKIRGTTYSNVAIGKADTSRYYLYNLHDILRDEAFLQLVEKHKSIFKHKKEEEEKIKLLPGNQRIKYLKNQKYDRLKVGVNDLIVMQPRVVHFTNDGVDDVRSEILENTILDAFSIASEESGTKITVVSDQSYQKEGTAQFNQRNALATRLEQMWNNRNVESFPVDFTLTNELIAQTGTSKVLFTIVENNFAPEFNEWSLVSCILVIPIPIVLSSHIPKAILRGNNTNLSVVLLDLENGEILTYYQSEFDVPLNKNNMAAHLYDLFQNLKATPTQP